jgi:tripartite-type tricarboxylate transporter receptor subunit TctC
MIRIGQLLLATGAAITLVAAQGGGAEAQSLKQILKTKKVSMYISSGAGGTYDAYARIISRHMGNHLPGKPKVLPRNMPGASGLRATKFLYRVAPKDGTAMAMLQRSVTIQPLLGVKAADYDARKLNWLGSTTREVSTGIIWHTSPLKTLSETMKTPLIVGSSGIGSDTGAFPRVLNHFIGTKFKIVYGYKSGSDISLALERKEVMGRLGWSWSSIKSRAADLLRDKKIRVFVQMGLKPAPDLPGVPMALDHAKSPEDRRAMEIIFAPTTVGWPSAMPPGVAPKTVAIFRAAYNATMKDPGFLKDTKRRRLPVAPVTGKEIHKLLDRIYSFPEADVALARQAYGSGVGRAVKVKLIKVSGVISKINKKGSKLTLAGKSKVKGRVSRRTKIKISGKKSKRKALKKGMNCSMKLVASGSVVHNLNCK